MNTVLCCYKKHLIECDFLGRLHQQELVPEVCQKSNCRPSYQSDYHLTCVVRENEPTQAAADRRSQGVAYLLRPEKDGYFTVSAASGPNPS